MDSNTSYNSNLLKARSRDLVMNASIESSMHIHDDTIKVKLIRSYSNVANGIVREFDSGRNSLNDALQSIKNEANLLHYQSELINQSKKYPKALNKAVGIAAGLVQIYEGALGAFASFGLFLPADLMFLHGINNVYEGGAYFLNGGNEVDGFMKDFYQYVSTLTGNPAEYGTVAYDMIDLALSIRGILALTDKMKMSRFALTNGRKQRFILFDAYKCDFLRGFEATTRRMLIAEGVSDGFTTTTLINDINEVNKKKNSKTTSTYHSLNDTLQSLMTQSK